MTAAQLDALVTAHTEAPLAGILGEPHVNVLALNRGARTGGRRRA